MKVIYDKGKDHGIYRFLNYETPRKLDEDNEHWLIILINIIACAASYSFKHKCWIIKL